MATLEDAARLAMALPGVTEGLHYGNRTWFIDKDFFAWERPFSKADVKRFGDEPVPEGPILAVKVEDESDKQAVLQAGGPAVFTISHFDGFAAVLVQLDEVSGGELAARLEDAWLAVAPADLATEYIGDNP